MKKLLYPLLLILSGFLSCNVEEQEPEPNINLEWGSHLDSAEFYNALYDPENIKKYLTGEWELVKFRHNYGPDLTGDELFDNRTLLFEEDQVFTKTIAHEENGTTQATGTYQLTCPSGERYEANEVSNGFSCLTINYSEGDEIVGNCYGDEGWEIIWLNKRFQLVTACYAAYGDDWFEYTYEKK
ncbi:hypothetical protein [Echinicola rosea]|uniref:Lipocalin-like domain-containing protein n=1 Tax=Echinicola rosea TaxID=1807691 RepID=A0ABQ1UV65_9BACT|nr:hypothetical protein [Echinicola rosea]GGF27663.1 hypothetical protein GCM10011339_14690 [Echinicola rosea]